MLIESEKMSWGGNLRAFFAHRSGGCYNFVIIMCKNQVKTVLAGVWCDTPEWRENG